MKDNHVSTVSKIRGAAGKLRKLMTWNEMLAVAYEDRKLFARYNSEIAKMRKNLTGTKLAVKRTTSSRP